MQNKQYREKVRIARSLLSGGFSFCASLTAKIARTIQIQVASIVSQYVRRCSELTGAVMQAAFCEVSRVRSDVKRIVVHVKNYVNFCFSSIKLIFIKEKWCYVEKS